MINLKGRKVNLAWWQLSRQPGRFIVAIIGVATAGILIFLQLGLLGALFDSGVVFHRLLQADLIITSRDYQFLNNSGTFTKARLAQAYGHSDIKEISGVLLEPLPIKDFKSHSTRLLLAAGIDPNKQDFQTTDILSKQIELKQIGSVLIDRRARPEFRGMIKELKTHQNLSIESNQARLRAIGTVAIGPTFGTDGMAITSPETVWFIRGKDDDDTAQIGLLRLKDKRQERAKEIMQHLRKMLPEDVDIMTKQEFIERELNYWHANTPAAFIFNLGAWFSFFIGMVVVYQIIYAEVIEFYAEYATLMAIGHPFRRLLISIICQGLIIGAAGYPPTLAVSLLVYDYIRTHTSLPIAMSPERAAFVLAAIVVMTTSAAVLAVARLRQIDPAEVF